MKFFVSNMAAATLTKDMTDEQFEEHALALLRRELGVDGLARFLRLHGNGSGDYTAERQTWQSGLTVKAILRELKGQATRS